MGGIDVALTMGILGFRGRSRPFGALLGGREATNYSLDLFTGTTWDEFQKAGAELNG